MIPLSPASGGLCAGPALLQPADLIVSTTSHLDSGVIRAGTWSDVSHAAVYVGDGNVIEAVGKGVRQYGLAEAMADDSLAVAYRHTRITPESAAMVIEFARSKIGLHYDYGGAVGAGLRAHPWVCVTLLGPIECAVAMEATQTAEVPRKFFCSELVLAAYKAAGVPIAPVSHRSDPQGIVDAYADGTLAYVGHLKP